MDSITPWQIVRECKIKVQELTGPANNTQYIENDWSIRDYLRETKKSYICQFLPSNITLENYQQVLQEQFLYIGITESLQNSVNILAQKLGFSSMMVLETNVLERTESIPDGAREEFIKNNPLEMAVYRYAKGNFGN